MGKTASQNKPPHESKKKKKKYNKREMTWMFPMLKGLNVIQGCGSSESIKYASFWLGFFVSLCFFVFFFRERRTIMFMALQARDIILVRKQIFKHLNLFSITLHNFSFLIAWMTSLHSVADVMQNQTVSNDSFLSRTVWIFDVFRHKDSEAVTVVL